MLATADCIFCLALRMIHFCNSRFSSFSAPAGTTCLCTSAVVSSSLRYLRQSGPRPDPRLLRQTALEVLTRSARSDSPRKTRPEQIPAKLAAAAAAAREEKGGRRVIC
ncbi:L-ascorbate oxidase [Dorcoceras hygrometricum]|uniref:L-ascorbate oxidase n=1 Tax=Dorcoceras hygrometricum TaxID=472368 RepID=A0A2Z6ZZG5_9LAMI|nr:L-ascorbate oxidase [Dorcoceras hygrometricum]